MKQEQDVPFVDYEDGYGELADRSVRHQAGCYYSRPTVSLDRRLFQLLHRRAGELRLIDGLLLGCARHGPTGEVLLMLLVGARHGRAGRGAVRRCLLAVAALYQVCELLGRVAARPRPFASDPNASALIAHTPGRSFPSRHVASATAMATIVAPASRSLSASMALLALAMAVGRVRAGLHYPSDVVAGAGLGFAVGLGLRRRIHAG